MTTAGGMKVGLPADHVGECIRVDMPRPALPQERIQNGDFGLLGTLWNILSGGWLITLNLATNLGLGLAAGVTQTFPAQSIRIYVTGVAGIVLNSVSLVG